MQGHDNPHAPAYIATAHANPIPPTAHTTNVATTNESADASASRCDLLSLPTDILLHVLFPMLDDGDAMDLFAVNKYMMYKYTERYAMKEAIMINAATVGKSYYRTEAAVPMPIISSIRLVFDSRATSLPDFLSGLRIVGNALRILNIHEMRTMDLQCLPASLEELHVGLWDGNEDSSPQCTFPSKLIRLHFTLLGASRVRLYPGIFPPTLEELGVYRVTMHEGELNANILPPSLISFSSNFLISNVLPSTLETLAYSGPFKLELTEGMLPHNLQRLSLGSSFKEPIAPHILPSCLIKLELAAFNHPISTGTLPSTLQELDLGDNFNQHLVELPSSLRILTLGTRFSHEFTSALPSQLEELRLDGVHANLHLDEKILPQSLKILGLPTGFRGTLSTALLTALPLLTKIIFCCPYLSTSLESTHLPPSSNLKSFVLCDNYRDRAERQKLPDNLHRLELIDVNCSFINIGVLPPHLKKLIVYDSINELKPNVLPPGLQRLILGGNYNYTIKPSVFPDSIEILELPLDYSHPITFLPSNLKHLVLPASYPFHLDPSIVSPTLQIHSKGHNVFPKRPHQYFS